MFVLTPEVIEIGPVRNAVQRAEAGAVLVFEGITRNHHQGREVTRLEYEAYPGMAEAEMSKIAEQIAQQWPDVRVAMAHRVGVVPIGEASVVIATSAPHRDVAYAASRFAIDALKASVPIWKKEVYVDGSVWKTNRETADAPGF